MGWNWGCSWVCAYLRKPELGCGGVASGRSSWKVQKYWIFQRRATTLVRLVVHQSSGCKPWRQCLYSCLPEDPEVGLTSHTVSLSAEQVPGSRAGAEVFQHLGMPWNLLFQRSSQEIVSLPISIYTWAVSEKVEGWIIFTLLADIRCQLPVAESW